MDTATKERPGADAHRDRSVAFAHAAMSSLMAHGIPPSPAHLAIWFDYHAGAHPMVRRVIDAYVSNGKPITENLLHEIHEHFFDTRRESAANVQTSQRLTDTLAKVTELVTEADGHSASYGRSLGTSSQESASQDGNLAAALQRMIATTTEMVRRSAEVGAKLESSSRVVSDLRERLQAALVDSRTDVLTGLPNRRAIEDAATRLLHNVETTGEPLAIAMLDKDRFRAVNDTWGHQVGDAVLRRVASTL